LPRRYIRRGGIMKSFFTPKEVQKVVGISYRQIEGWDKTNFIKPSYRRRGKYRLYVFADLLKLKITKVLLDRGFSLHRLRKTIPKLRALLPNVGHPLVELTFLFDMKDDRILVFSGEVLMSEGKRVEYIQFGARTLRDEINRMFPDPLEQAESQTTTA
jgi:DNA-binding transcriptional MerR regulator